MENSSDLILAYFEKEIKQENIIDQIPILLKFITVGMYLIEVTCTLVMFSFVAYERWGYAGAYRSIINQLLAYCYGGVSSKVSLLGVVALWVDCTFFPADLGVIVADLCYVALFEDFSL